MNSKTYSVYAKNKNNKLYDENVVGEELYDIEDLVVGNVLTCEQNGNGVIYSSSPSKHIFEKVNVENRDIYKELYSHKEIKTFSTEYNGPFITNIEDLTDYIDVVTYKADSPDLLLTMDDIVDLENLVNVINKEEKNMKKKSL